MKKKLNTAQNAQMPCISVSWGFKTNEFLIKHKAKIIVDSPSEILTQVENLSE